MHPAGGIAHAFQAGDPHHIGAEADEPGPVQHGQVRGRIQAGLQTDGAQCVLAQPVAHQLAFKAASWVLLARCQPHAAVVCEYDSGPHDLCKHTV